MAQDVENTSVMVQEKLKTEDRKIKEKEVI